MVAPESWDPRELGTDAPDCWGQTPSLVCTQLAAVGRLEPFCVRKNSAFLSELSRQLIDCTVLLYGT